ncbi:hypothetical protein [Chitinophaga sp. CF418]|uniref:hypothetical protein n=1 Tax=Chitinophaga sp. CF418 TaxID=1855287 RepID=UPI0009105FA6|nr:hypothetical protein [Chitinophaga sp. CF418]SHM94206.1 hypothetical protein SAMN05216311_10447 [Chitinophaga sp. CF418]
MPKILFSVCLLLSLCLNSFAQEETKRIVDYKSHNLTDSIKAGMQVIARDLGMPINKLNFYVMLEEALVEVKRYTITMEAYPKGAKFKYQHLIDSTNEFLKVDDNLILPSIFDFDLFREMMTSEGYSKGYVLMLDITDGKETIKTRFISSKK